jgi:parallel beta-helix repeat protein
MPIMRRLLLPLIIFSLLVPAALCATPSASVKNYIQKTFHSPEIARLFRPGAGGLFTYDKNHFFLNSGYQGQAAAMSSLKPAEKMALEALAKRSGAAAQEAASFSFGRKYSDGYELRKGKTAISIKPIGKARGSVEDGLLVYKNIDRRMDVVFAPAPGGVEELFLIKSGGKSKDEIERKITVGNGADIKINSKGELETGGLVLSAPLVIDAKGKRVSGRYELKEKSKAGQETSALLALSFDPSGLTYPILIDPTWQTAGDMSMTRSGWTGRVATLLLPNGKVLVIGGHSGQDRSSELFNPATGTWSTGGTLNYQGNGRSLFWLSSGKALAIGNINPPYILGPAYAAEKYDPATNSWTAAGTYPSPYYIGGAPTALLTNGKILMVNGDDSNESNPPYTRCDLYDPTTETFTQTGSTLRGCYATLTVLPNGQVLAAGGQKNNVWDSRCELYTPWTGTWSQCGSLNAERTDCTATLLTNGQVLVVGGDHLVIDGENSYIGYLDTAELFLNGAWSYAGHLSTARAYHTATLLPNGQVLVAGGASVPVPYGSTVYYDSCELYDSGAMSSDAAWSTTGSLNTARGFHAAILLNNGQVLVAGGSLLGVGDLKSCELYGSPSTYLITSEADPHGTIAPSGTTTVALGGSQSYTITAQLGYSISDVQVDGVSVGPVNNYTFSNVSADHRIHASISLLGYLITSEADPHGTIAPSGTSIVTPGGSKSYTLTADPGYSISDVQVDGVSVGPVNNYTFSNVSADHRIYLSIVGSTTWQYTGNMPNARYWHTATLLYNGKVLVAGGDYPDNRHCELYNPTSGSWISTGLLNYGRSVFRAELLTNGQVLAVGSTTIPSELYNPDTGSWSVAGTSALPVDNYWYTLTRLANGQVLRAGGQANSVGSFPYCELYDPISGTWRLTGSMRLGRNLHTATLLPNGKVLVVGGQGWAAGSCELYDPSTGTWSDTGGPNVGRAAHTATLLPNGKVLVAGGAGTTACEIYDPATGRWALTGSLSIQRGFFGQQCSTLHNGQILIVAGGGNNASCEQYDPLTGIWTAARSLNTPRWYHTATLLSNGNVLAAGGQTAGGPTNTSELYGAFIPSHGMTFEVTNTNDNGEGSLRQCILYANATPGFDDIVFNIPSDQATGAPGAYRWLITPATALPPLTESVRILGSTQPTDSTYRNLYGPVIEVRGPGAPQWTGDLRGIDIAAPFCVIEGLTINGFSNGLVLSGVLTTNCQICNNYLGTDYMGGTAPGNFYNGVKIDGGASDNVIGLAGAKNVISGNRFGITISGANGNQINANYIGTDSTGTGPLGNTDDGIQLRSGAFYNRIGDGTAGGRNVISGNSLRGIIAMENSTATVIIGNYIGCNAAGTGALGNGDSGIWLWSAGCTARIGGAAAGEGNVISGNANAGVYLSSSNNLVQGNYIGCDRTGGTALPNGWAGIGIDGGNYNQIGGNVISGNDADGLNLYNSSSNEVVGNLIGCDLNGGLMIHGGNSGDGIVIDSSNYNRIGDGTSGGLNVIAGNTYVGVFLTSGSTGNTLTGNYIGCGSDGVSPLANSTGVELADSPANTVGGTANGAGNLISGNSSEGLWITGASNTNSILGNYIGCDLTGNVPLPNGTVPTDAGILINEGASHNRIGNGTAQGANRIFGNNGYGLKIDSFGGQSDYNTISRNSFHDNTGWGIALWDGANEYMPAPTIESGFLTAATGEALANATVEVYATGAPDPSGAGEGRTYIGSVKAGSDGHWLLNYSLTAATTLTATATNQNGSTSQFSRNVTAEGTPAGLTLVVTNCADSGPGSLRQAIRDANDHFGRDTITFNIPTTDAGYLTASWGSYWRITPASLLPEITDSVAILGSTQATNEGDLNSHGPEIEIRGDRSMTYGLKVNGALPSSLASNSTIEGLVINNFVYGLQLHGLDYNYFSGCNIHDNYLGTDPSGASSVYNAVGLYLEYGTGNRIANNLASGNSNWGIYLAYGISSEVLGNYVGCDASGESFPVGSSRNAGGLGVVYGSHNMIGGNLISGNSNGLMISSSSDNRVTGNFIGTDKSGHNPLGNNTGIYLGDTYSSPIGPGNVIAFNNSDGVHFASNAWSDTITQNSIFQNQGLEINTGYSTDTMQPPTILTADLSGVTGEAQAYSTVEVFAVDVPNHTGYGGGRYYLGSALADSNGQWIFPLETAVATVTATATDQNGNSSQFAQNFKYNGLNFVVINTNDSDPGSLRYCLTMANAATGRATITFNIPNSMATYDPALGAYFWRITPQTGLPWITNSVAILGSTQPTDSTYNNPYGPVIELRGLANGGTTDGLIVQAAGCSIEGLVINGFAFPDAPDHITSAIKILGTSATGNRIYNNYLGTSVIGTRLPDTYMNENGITIFRGASHNLIGGATDAERNLISGAFSAGIRIGDGYAPDGSSSNEVKGNYIGTDRNGTAVLGSSQGVLVQDGSYNNLIGGAADGERNVISGNLSDGVLISNGASNEVKGNYIGIDKNGTAALPNGYSGIGLDSANYNQIGGPLPGEGNVISGNYVGGIGFTTGPGGSNYNVLQGNYVGTDKNGTAAVPNGFFGINVFNGNYNLVGGAAAGEGNLISGNDAVGLEFADDSYNRAIGNYIGTDKTGVAPLPNITGMVIAQSAFDLIGGLAPGEGNIIANNVTYGISLGNFGVTHNNEIKGNYIGYNGLDGLYVPFYANYNLISRNTMEANGGLGIFIDAGGNNNIQPPVTASALLAGSQTTVTGTAAAGAVIEIFKADANPDPAGGEGKVFLSSVEADGAGNWIVTLQGLVQGDIVTATQTMFNSYGGYTSQFSLNGVVAAKYVVTTTADSGFGSLRQCLMDSNADPGRQTITFLIPRWEATSESGVKAWRIAPPTALPPISDAVCINASSQPTDETYDNSYGPEIELSGPGDGSFSGLTLQAANCTIEGLVINNGFTNGFFLSGAAVNHNNIYGNYIGTDVTGEVAVGNYSSGIFLASGANYNLIQSNLISGNDSSGISIYNSGTSHNQISGNIIGLNRDGDAAIGNISGIFIYDDARDNIIGGTSAATRNVISGNSGNGIDIESVYGPNQITGNYIGTNSQGIGPVANNNDGIYLWDVKNCQVGLAPGTPGPFTMDVFNVISGNNSYGLQFDGASSTVSGNWVRGCLIGTDRTGALAVGNRDGGILLDTTVNTTIEMNVISGSDFYGVILYQSNSNEVLSNYIGTVAGGTGSLPNGHAGIDLVGSSFNKIGNGTSRNWISGNGSSGILFQSGSNSNEVTMNYIGIGLPSVDQSLPNHDHGISIEDGGGSFNKIGPDNTVAHNGTNSGHSGVLIAGSANIGNTITQNSLYENFGLGIKLNGGANNGIQPPIINAAAFNPTSRLTNVIGTAEANVSIEVFATGNPDPTGSGEGRTFLFTTTANANGTWEAMIGSLTGGTTLTATATDTHGNTSEFALNLKSEAFYIALNISREADTPGSAIVVSWTESTVPDVYVLTGDGTGVYTDEVSRWTQVTNTTPVNGFSVIGNELHHAGQVGGGTSEAYYKALKAGGAIGFLPSAEAVGKVNILVQTYPPTMELVALLVVPDNNDINAVIGAQFGNGSGEVWSRFNDPINGWGSHQYNGSFWHGSLPANQMTKDRGYWIKSLTADKTLTFVGRVTTTNESYSFNNENLFFYGNSYPRTVSWEASGLSTIFNNGDQIWQWDNGWESVNYYGSQNPSLPWGHPILPGLMFRHGFWVSKHSAAGTWNFPKPY